MDLICYKEIRGIRALKCEFCDEVNYNGLYTPYLIVSPTHRLCCPIGLCSECSDKTPDECMVHYGKRMLADFELKEEMAARGFHMGKLDDECSQSFVDSAAEKCEEIERRTI